MARGEETEFWNNEGGARWKLNADRVAAIFAPVTRRLLDVADPRVGERVLEIGCGTGPMIGTLTDRIGSSGRLVALDVSRVLLDVARESSAGRSNVQFLLADAQTHDFGSERFDLVISQFGVMFFADPVRAFRNVRAALAPRGRVVFACWRDFSASPFFYVPINAAKRFAPPQPPEGPDVPGPFAFAQRERLQQILQAAGFSEIDIVAHDESLVVDSTRDAEIAASRIANFGPTGRILSSVDEEKKAQAFAAIAEAFRPFLGPEGLRLGAGIWLVSAAGTAPSVG